jgi:hypothetical protein
VAEFLTVQRLIKAEESSSLDQEEGNDGSVGD